MRAVIANSAFADIRDIISIPNWLLLLAILAACIAGVFLAALWWRFRAQRLREESETESREPPHLAALRELRELRTSGASMEAERFTVKVSNVLRRYLEEALGLPALEQTSEEFLRDLGSQSWLTDELAGDLEIFMRSSDLVKFARQGLRDGQREQLVDSAVKVVQATGPASQPEQPEPTPVPANG